MKEYHKIQTIFKRDTSKRILEGQWTLPEFEFLQKNIWVFTEKVDGTNIRIMFDGVNITFGGRTDNSQIPTTLINRLNEKFLPIIPKLSEVFNWKNTVCLYGEGYGAKIQKIGEKYRSDQDFVLFDILVGDYWLQRPDIECISSSLGIDVVPIIGEGTLHDAITLVKYGYVSTWGDFQAEGIVARPKVELNARGGQRIIAKIKCRDFEGSK